LNSRQKVNNIIARKTQGAARGAAQSAAQSAAQGAYWTGHPNPRTVPLFSAEWGIEPETDAIYEYLNDDCRWAGAEGGYKHPDGLPMFNMSLGVTPKAGLAAGGCFEYAETVAEIESHPWPDAVHCDFTDVYARCEKFADKMVFTGMWCPFFHVLAGYFGMEKYFINMHENPKVVEAATERVVDFYVAANDKFFAGLKGRADIMFFGNDFGTQRDLIISTEHFRRFVLPGIRRIIETGKKYGLTVMMHSCGSIYRVIPDLIDAGIDMLHPIQAQAAGMKASDLAQYKNDLIFLGGIDAQSFLVDATPSQIKDEVRRVRDILGPGVIISPSHEEILPNVPAANIKAMSEAALETL